MPTLRWHRPLSVQDKCEYGGGAGDLFCKEGTYFELHKGTGEPFLLVLFYFDMTRSKLSEHILKILGQLISGDFGRKAVIYSVIRLTVPCMLESGCLLSHEDTGIRGEQPLGVLC